MVSTGCDFGVQLTGGRPGATSPARRGATGGGVDARFDHDQFVRARNGRGTSPPLPGLWPGVVAPGVWCNQSAPACNAVNSTNSLPGLSSHAATRLSPLGRPVIASGFSHSARASLAFRPLGPTSVLKHVGVAEVRRIPHERAQVIGQTDGVGPRGQESKAHAFEWLKPLATTERPKGESRATLQRRVQFLALPEWARLVVAGLVSSSTTIISSEPEMIVALFNHSRAFGPEWWCRSEGRRRRGETPPGRAVPHQRCYLDLRSLHASG